MEKFKCYGHQSWHSKFMMLVSSIIFLGFLLSPLWMFNFTSNKTTIGILFFGGIALGCIILWLSQLFLDVKLLEQHSDDELLFCYEIQLAEDEKKDIERKKLLIKKLKIKEVKDKYESK